MQKEWPELSPVIKNIVAALSPEKIYLLSVIHQRQEIRSIFIEDPSEQQLMEGLYILVLSGISEKRTNDEVQDIIEHGLGIPMSVTAFVLQAGQFSEWLKKEHPFAMRVILNARLCYDAGNFPLAAAEAYQERTGNDFSKSDLQLKIGKAREFLAGADLYIVRRQYEMAAFHLHQAAEQIYSGLIRFSIGLDVRTHNLDKLYRYSRGLLADLKDIFPRNTEVEKKLFHCLQKAYLGARYDTDYSIKYPEVFQLTERVNKLLTACQGAERVKTTGP
jgi:HEPN domain-containing protein